MTAWLDALWKLVMTQKTSTHYDLRIERVHSSINSRNSKSQVCLQSRLEGSGIARYSFDGVVMYLCMMYVCIWYWIYERVTTNVCDVRERECMLKLAVTLTTTRLVTDV